jgi:hypothetical protein
MPNRSFPFALTTRGEFSAQSPFVMVQLAAVEAWQRELYRAAYEQAQAVVRPSWLECDVLGVWN